jgi:hypothetical protein
LLCGVFLFFLFKNKNNKKMPTLFDLFYGLFIGLVIISIHDYFEYKSKYFCLMQRMYTGPSDFCMTRQFDMCPKSQIPVEDQNLRCLYSGDIHSPPCNPIHLDLGSDCKERPGYIGIRVISHLEFDDDQVHAFVCKCIYIKEKEEEI